MKKLKHSSILYVEDDEITKQNISSYLKRACKTLYIASNGQEGYDKFLEFSPDIIITDIEMPKLNGLDMAKKIRKKNSKTQIIITSAYTQQEYLMQAVNLHLIQYITKPLSMVKLSKALNDCEEYLEDKTQSKIFLDSKTYYDTQVKELHKTDILISLSKNERALLELLIKDYPSPSSYERIESKIYDFSSSKNAIKLLIKSLRNKTSKDSIINVSGLGYKLLRKIDE